MARGWERQLDRRLNPEFYDRDHPLDAARYHRWLLREGVSYVVLPDTSFDPSSQREAQLVHSGLGYLQPVYRDAHWTVYHVTGASALLDGPGRLVSADGRRIEFDARRAGRFTLRVRSFAVWRVDAGNVCTGTNADEWLTVDAASAGRVVLTQQDPLLSFFGGHADESCPAAGVAAGLGADSQRGSVAAPAEPGASRAASDDIVRANATAARAAATTATTPPLR